MVRWTVNKEEFSEQIVLTLLTGNSNIKITLQEFLISCAFRITANSGRSFRLLKNCVVTNQHLVFYRTNVVQSLLARRSLQAQCEVFI